MNKAECAKVLAKIQLGDSRQVDQLVLEEWFDTIGFLPFEAAIEGVRTHRRESTDYLLPAHVVKNARRAQDRLRAIESPSECPSHPGYILSRLVATCAACEREREEHVDRE